MTISIGFILQDADEAKGTAVVFSTPDNNFTFDQLKKLIEGVVDHPTMRDRYDLDAADRATTFDIARACNIPLARFTYHNVKLKDWCVSACKAIQADYPEGKVIVMEDVELLYRSIAMAYREVNFLDIVGDWNGVFVIKTEK